MHFSSDIRKDKQRVHLKKFCLSLKNNTENKNYENPKNFIKAKKLGMYFSSNVIKNNTQSKKL